MTQKSGLPRGAETLLQQARPREVAVTLLRHMPLFPLLFGVPLVAAVAEGERALTLALGLPEAATLALGLLGLRLPLPRDLRRVEAMAVLALLFLFAAVLSVPAFGKTGLTRMMKIGFSAFFAFLVLQTRLLPPGLSMHTLGLAAGIAGEVAIGLLFGWAVHLVLSALAFAGHLIGQEMGLNMANVVDPITGQESPILANMFEVMGVLLFYVLGLHRHVLRILDASFDALPAGRVDIGARRLMLWGVDGVAATFQYGVRLAGPVFVTLMCVTVGFALLMRAVPAINVFDIGFVTRILAALAILAGLLPVLLPPIRELFASLRFGLEALVAV